VGWIQRGRRLPGPFLITASLDAAASAAAPAPGAETLTDALDWCGTEFATRATEPGDTAVILMLLVVASGGGRSS
jgi:hypothetical protein